MKQILYDRKTLTVENERYYEMDLQYYLVEEEVPAEFCMLLGYGVEIRKIARFADGHTETECKRISNLFWNRPEAEAFVKKVAKNTVTPIGLKNVVEDCVEKKICSSPAIELHA